MASFKLLLRLPETKPFLARSCGVREARNTSASSNSKMQPHRLANAKCRSRAASTSFDCVPRSPTSKVLVHAQELSWTGQRTFHTAGYLKQGFLEMRCDTFYNSYVSGIESRVKNDLVAFRCLPAVVVFPRPGAPCSRMINPFLEGPKYQQTRAKKQRDLHKTRASSLGA